MTPILRVFERTLSLPAFGRDTPALVADAVLNETRMPSMAEDVTTVATMARLRAFGLRRYRFDTASLLPTKLV